MVVWGLWARVDPPAPGAHELHVRGSGDDGFSLDVRYHLTIVTAP